MEDGGGEVCGRTATHADLSRLDAAGQRALEAIVGHPVRCSAYPYGAFDVPRVQVLGTRTLADFVAAVPAA